MYVKLSGIPLLLLVITGMAVLVLRLIGIWLLWYTIKYTSTVSVAISSLSFYLSCQKEANMLFVIMQNSIYLIETLFVFMLQI